MNTWPRLSFFFISSFLHPRSQHAARHAHSLRATPILWAPATVFGHAGERTPAGSASMGCGPLRTSCRIASYTSRVRSHAKVLIVTDSPDRVEIRDAILRGNAERLLG